MKCDIIIPVWNEKVLTAKCIDSILKNTHSPYRILMIDNGSGPETVQYLNELSEQNPDIIHLKHNNENVGFPKAVNQGIELSDAPYICILNNDTEVYKDWLTEMIGIAESSSDIGIVNPASNNLGQKEPESGFSGKWIEMAACIGFCMLIKKPLIKKIGNFDEIYSPGNFEDADFSKRAVKAGYRCMLAKGAYVYHRQNISFKKRMDWDKSFKRNRDIFNEKWGKSKRVVYIITNGNLIGLKTNIVKFLKQGDWVWIILKEGSREIDIPRHTSLSIFNLGKFGFTIKVLWRVLKRKKRFNEVITDSKFFARVFRFFGYPVQFS